MFSAQHVLETTHQSVRNNTQSKYLANRKKKKQTQETLHES